MSRITRISRLRNCGVFRDFVWPFDLSEFGRYNLIYGWNWTGKTTLSRVLRVLELRKQFTMGEVELRIDGNKFLGQDFPHSTLPIRVFNRDFIEESVFRKDGEELPPIFVFGKESVEKQKEIERLKGEHANVQSAIDSARSTKQKAEKDFDQLCIERAKLIKDMLRSSGHNRYNNYDKADFKDDAEKMAKAGDAEAHRLSEDERDRLIAQHQSTPKPKVKEVTYSLPDFEVIRVKLSELLTTTVVSEAIEALKIDSELATWTREGLRLHRDRMSDQCLFCEQSLPKDRLAALEAHFSAQYERFLQKLDQFIVDLKKFSKEVSDLRLPSKAELYDDLSGEYEAAERGLTEVLKATQSFFDDAVQALKEKRHRVFEKISVTLQAPQADAEAVEKLNAVIRKHNQACVEFQDRVDEARKCLARDMIAAALAEFERLRDDMQRATEEEQEKSQHVQRLEAEIANLEREILEHRRPAEELNEDLQKYLGHSELRVDVKETGYNITRSGKTVGALSEGEKTAIALLYFLKSLEDKSFDKQNGVIVLDDPVSSLDGNALYLAFGLIRERTKEACQVILMTHNFELFRLARNWLHHEKKEDRRFYMLECQQQSEERKSSLKWIDPLLEQYESEYHYLFAYLYRMCNERNDSTLETYYHAPNAARRLIEGLLAFKFPEVAGNLYKAFQRINFEESKKTRILRFLHTQSHGSDLVPGHDPSGLQECRSVLTDLFDLIKAVDESHFNSMVTLVISST